MLDKIKKIVKQYKVIENIIIIGSVISVNFAAYLAYFDVNTFMLVDSSTITKYTFEIIILFTLISALISIIILILQHYSLIKQDNIFFFPIIKVKNEDSSKIYKILNNKILKYALIIITFSFIYVGILNTIKILGIFLAFFILVFIVDLLKTKKDPIHNEEKIRQDLKELKFYNNSPQFFKKILKTALIFDNILTQEITFIIQDGKSYQLILSRLGIMLIFLSLSLGIGRANYIEKHFLVSLNKNNNSSESNLVLFLTTKNGLCLFNPKKNQVSFVSWGAVKNMVLLPKTSYSIRKLFIPR